MEENSLRSNKKPLSESWTQIAARLSMLYPPEMLRLPDPSISEKDI